jgi:hypothetical protein
MNVPRRKVHSTSFLFGKLTRGNLFSAFGGVSKEAILDLHTTVMSYDNTLLIDSLVFATSAQFSCPRKIFNEAYRNLLVDFLSLANLEEKSLQKLAMHGRLCQDLPPLRMIIN